MELKICKSLWDVRFSRGRASTQSQMPGTTPSNSIFPTMTMRCRFFVPRGGPMILLYYTLILTAGPDHLTSFGRLLERARRAGADFVTSSGQC